MDVDGVHLVENPREQEAIRLICALRRDGYSYRAIGEELVKESYEPLGKMWHPETIDSILKRVA